MSLQNIALPDVVLAGLYKKNVIQGDISEVASASASPSTPSPSQDSTPAIPAAQPKTAVVPPQPVAPPVAAGTTQAASPVSTQQSAPSPQPVQPVATPVATTATAAPLAAGASYKFLGNNKQQVVIAVRFPGEAFMPEAHLAMLSKMLGACKLNLGDVAIVNDATARVEINSLKEQLQPKKLLLFGITPDETGLPLHFPQFKDQEYAGCVYLHAPSLHELNQENEDGKVLKRRLWESLKKMFGV